MTDYAPLIVEVVDTQARQVGFQDGQSRLLLNRDELNTVYLGGDEGIDAGGNDTAPLDPLGSRSLDGSADVWARCLAGQSAVVSSEPGTTDAQVSPAQIAIQLNALGLAKDSSVQGVNLTLAAGTNPAIAGTTAAVGGTTAAVGAQTSPGNTIADDVAAQGVPLLNLHNVLFNRSGTIAAAGFVGGQVLVTQPGYAWVLTIQHAAGAATPFAQLNISQNDTILTNSALESVNWYLGSSNAPTQPNVYFGKGPTLGDQFEFTLINLDGTNSLVYTFQAFQHSHVLERHSAVNTTNSFTAPNGQSLGSQDADAGILCRSAPSVAATSSAVRLLPVYSGLVHIHVSNVAQTARFLINSVQQITPGGQTTAIWDSGPLAANSFADADVYLPRMHTQLVLENTGAAAQVLTALVTTAEQET